jgi:hypothetical protein
MTRRTGYVKGVNLRQSAAARALLDLGRRAAKQAVSDGWRSSAQVTRPGMICARRPRPVCGAPRG